SLLRTSFKTRWHAARARRRTPARPPRTARPPTSQIVETTMARSGNLPAELEPRDSDVRIPALLLPKIPPFFELKTMANLFNFPGSVILRRFRKGDVVCRQGEAGWTAFYIPKANEIQAIREAPRKQLEIAMADLAKAEGQVADRKKQLIEASGDP